MLAMVVAAETFQVEMSWLKEVALENIPLNEVTFPTFHVRGLAELSPASPLLKLEAPMNMLAIFVTSLVSQDDTSRLNAVA
jgi:hypothetical protein